MSWSNDRGLWPGDSFNGGVDYPWWAEDVPNSNKTVVCDEIKPQYRITTSIICAMFLVFGIVYSLFGYRCFKAVMFLTGFLFGSVSVYLICATEGVLPIIGDLGVAMGAGILFGLVTMLVQYVGLFMTGFHTGLFMGVAVIVTASIWWTPASVWPVLGILLICGLIMAVSTLYFQKSFTILGTAVSGGAIMSATMDYFIEELMMIYWFRDRLGGVRSGQLCWFSWCILAVWPFMIVVGTFTQCTISGKAVYHQPSTKPQRKKPRKSGNNNTNRARTRETRAELRQKKYRYLYQVRTAHGDIISQEYVQNLQNKAYPTGDNGTLQSDSTHTTMLAEQQSAPVTESEDECLDAGKARRKRRDGV